MVNDDNALDFEPRSSDEIFPMLSDEFRQDLVAAALQHRTQDKAVRKQLNTELRRVKVHGFRDASRAPSTRLARSVLEAIKDGDHFLARAVLNAWMASCNTLRDAVKAHLASRDIIAPEPPDARFDSFWTRDEWLNERLTMTANDGELDGEAVGLMLCLVSRRYPAPPPLESPLFCKWIDELQELSPDSVDWAETGALIKWVQDIDRMKRRDLVRRRQMEVEGACKLIREAFDEDLRYLDVDPDSWPADVEDRPWLAGPTREFLNALKDQLEAYQPVRPQGASREEEIERSDARRSCEEAIFRLVSDWRKLLAKPDPPDELQSETASAKLERAANDRAVAADQGFRAELESLKAEYDQLQNQVTSLRGKYEGVADENSGLQAEKAQREQEVDRLKEELSRSHRSEEHWRQAYVAEARRPRAPEADAPPSVTSVEQAIAQARETFPERLLIKLNSKSKQDTPFDSPAEVADALAWLATAYRNTRPESIGEACPGWFYKGGQSEVTKGQFRDWYRTRVDGITWDLSTHIGKGNSHDPRRTIRIAFAWDEQNDRVIIGFIGTHQRNRQS